MQAFVNQFADTMVDGRPAVSAKVISFWQGFAEMTKTLGMFAGGPIADRIGRKSVLSCLSPFLSLTSSQIWHVHSHRGFARGVDCRNYRYQLAGMAWWRHAHSFGRWIGPVSPGHLPLRARAVPDSRSVDRIVPAHAGLWSVDRRRRRPTHYDSPADQVQAAHCPRVFVHWGKSCLCGDPIFADVQALILMIGFVPESHIYYARKGQHENAKRSMARLYGTAADYDVVCHLT